MIRIFAWLLAVALMAVSQLAAGAASVHRFSRLARDTRNGLPLGGRPAIRWLRDIYQRKVKSVGKKLCLGLENNPPS